MNTRRLFGDIIDSTFTLSSEDGLRDGVGRIAAHHGFDGFAYLSLQAKSARSFAISNYSPEWQSIYFVRSYMVIDPVVTMGKRIMKAFQWSVDKQRRAGSKDERGFWDAALEFNVRSGLSVPILAGFGQVAMLTLASSSIGDTVALSDAEAATAATAVAFLHSRLGRSENPSKLREPGLTDREALCMRWAAAGKSMKDIALISGLTYHTVRWDLDNVRAKLDVTNLKEALAVAAALRLI